MSETLTPPRPTNLPDLVAKMQEVGDPQPVNMAPETWGWAALAAIAALLLLIAGYRFFRHRRANAYRREALRALEKAGDEPSAVSDILKRAALAAYPRKNVANLYGAAWREALETTGAGHIDPQFETAGYSRNPPKSIPGLNATARHWVRHHKR